MIFIYGENTYLCRRTLKEISNVATQKGFSLEYFFCSKSIHEGFSSQNDPIAIWQERVRQRTIWGTKKKLFVFFQPFASEAFQQSFLQGASFLAASGDTIVFYEEGVPERHNKFFLFLQKRAKCYECSHLSARALREWIKKEIRRFGGSIALSALSQLAWISQGDLWRLENDIKKLTAFSRGTLITEETIAKVCTQDIQTTVFQFVDAVVQKNRGAGLMVLRRKITDGEDPLRLFGALVAQFRKLLLVREALDGTSSLQRIKTEWKIHPYVLQKTLHQARHFSHEELKKIYRLLFAIDVKLKTETQDPQALLELLILNIGK
jgi:DNA polymerase III delta subunit